MSHDSKRTDEKSQKILKKEKKEEKCH